MPVSQRLPTVPDRRGRHERARSLYSDCALNAKSGLERSRGRMVRRLMVPPTEPSIVLASETLITSTELIIEAARSSKLMPERPDPDPTVETPLISTRLASVPRICTPRPTPASRVIWTPVTFSSTSARFWSGSLPMSSALMTSTRLSALRFSTSALCSEARMPLTMTASTSVF